MIQVKGDIGVAKKWRRRSARLLPAQQGFTLLEVLVGLAIMGIAVVVLFQIFSANLRSIAVSEDYTSAAVKAEARMREVLDNDKLEESSWSEVTAEGYRLDIVIAETLNQRTELLPVRLLDVVLTINWKKGAKDKSMTLRTIKMVGRQSEQKRPG
jgi:prepilin-type N-terminal cleavage/methylation domain-containing protein